MGHEEKRLNRVTEKAAQLIDPGERVVGAVYGVTGPLSPNSQIVGFLILLGIVKTRVVILTEKNVYVMQGTMWSTTGVKKVISKYPRGTVDASSSGYRLTVGEHRISTNLFLTKRSKEMAEQISRAYQESGGTQVETEDNLQS